MEESTERAKDNLTLNVRLKPVADSDRPVSANYTSVGVSQGIGYLDFGFIEPGLLASVVRQARNGGAMPKGLEGKLTARIALPLNGLVRLQQQLQQVLIGLRGGKSAKTE